jgi:hypothetical protein
VLTQWEANDVLFHKLIGHDTSTKFVDVGGAPGIWIERADHVVFYLGRSGEERRFTGYLSGNTLVWQRGSVSYRLEAGVSLERALELARSLRPSR